MAAKKKPASKPAAKSASADKPGPMDNIARGMNTAGKVVHEVLGGGDVNRFVKNPNLKTTASLALTVAAYAAGPAALGRKATLVANAVKAKSATAPIRAAENAAKAAKTSRVMKATKGAGTVTTKSGKALPMTGVKSFSTAKSPARSASSTYSMVNRQAAQAGAKAGAKAQKNVIAGFAAGGGLMINKAGTTVSTQNQKPKKKK
jgi:hypothetical protein